jgi:superfamily I DNA and/or RNA helicase
MTNRAEAVRCLHVIKSLLASGVPPSAIGVICLYRAQAELLSTMLSSGDGCRGGAGRRDAGIWMSCDGDAVAPPSDSACSWDATGDVAQGVPQSHGCWNEVMQEITISTVDAFQARSHHFQCKSLALRFPRMPYLP